MWVCSLSLLSSSVVVWHRNIPCNAGSHIWKLFSSLLVMLSCEGYWTFVMQTLLKKISPCGKALRLYSNNPISSSFCCYCLSLKIQYPSSCLICLLPWKPSCYGHFIWKITPKLLLGRVFSHSKTKVASTSRIFDTPVLNILFVIV